MDHNPLLTFIASGAVDKSEAKPSSKKFQKSMKRRIQNIGLIQSWRSQSRFLEEEILNELRERESEFPRKWKPHGDLPEAVKSTIRQKDKARRRARESRREYLTRAKELEIAA